MAATRVIQACFVAVSLAVVFSPAAIRAQGPVKAGQCVQIIAESIPPATSMGTAASFSATRVEDIKFSVFFPVTLSGDHIIELKVYTPRGGLYEVLTVPVSTSPAAGSRAVSGYPRPLPVQKLETVTSKTGTYLSGSAVLLVGGTQITQNSLFGRWRVDPYLDSEAKPCGPSLGFELKP